MNIRVSQILRGVVVVWVLFSIGYILVDRWDHAVSGKLEEAFGSGRKAAVEQIVELGKQCQTVNLTWSGGQMSMVNPACGGSTGAPQIGGPGQPPPAVGGPAVQQPPRQ